MPSSPSLLSGNSADEPAADAGGAAATASPGAVDEAVSSTTMPALETAAAGSAGPFDGAEYESDAVLVSLSDNGADAQAVVEKLAADANLPGLALLDEGPGFVRLSLPQGISVADAVARIGASDPSCAVQPNFVYHVAEQEPEGGVSPDAELAYRAGAACDAANLEAAFPLLDVQSSIVEGDATALWHLGSPNGLDAFRAWDVVRNYDYGEASASAAPATPAASAAPASPVAPTPASPVAAQRVTVAVLDNCFNVSHEDLVNNVVAAHSVTDVPDADIGNSKSQGNPDHGTHVAGIIGAQADNKAGTAAGVSYNARVMPVRISDAKGGITTDYLVKAYEYVLEEAEEHNVRVINLSVGGGRGALNWSEDDRLLFDRIDEAYERGIVSVVAACNTDSSSDIADEAPFYAFPADYPTCVTVIAVGQDGSLVPSSNYNKDGQTEKDIAAPGRWIYSTKMRGYGNESGTSMATAMVSGTLALMFAGDPDLTSDEAVSRLHSTAFDLAGEGWDAETGYGRVDAYAAVSSSASMSGGKAVLKGGDLRLEAKGAEGPWTWKSADESVATVSDGVVRGVASGFSEITATSGDVVVRQVVSVYDPVVVSGSSAVVISDGACSLGYSSSCRLKVEGVRPGGVWAWSSDAEEVASVDRYTGVVSACKAGTATVTVALKDAPDVFAAVRVTVTPVDIASAVIALAPSTCAYTGLPCQPSIASVKLGGTTLTSGVDYRLSGYADNTAVGQGRVSIVGLGNYTGTATARFAIYEAGGEGSPAGPSATMYRLYNQWSGEHFYTASEVERDDVAAAGWTYEGLGWTAPALGAPVYRLYNPFAGDHHYTLDDAERDDLVVAGWSDEGVGWYSGGEVPLYREYNPNAVSCNHNYTADRAEHDILLALGWRDEGIAWYGL